MDQSADLESSGDELEALLLAELEQAQAEETAATAQEDPLPPSSKRQKTGEMRGAACPPHPGFMGGICIRCGAHKPAVEIQHLGSTQQPPTNSSIALKYIHHGLEVSRDEAARLREGTVQRCLASRRLLLILDLDHTLLHSTRFSDLTVDQDEALRACAASQTGPPEEHLLHRLQYMSMWTKLRPGIRHFLAATHELFDLHVYTMGDKDYAAGMAALLDPDGRLFGGRVASSSDAGPSGVKDIDVLLGAEGLVLIVDDTVGVWPKHRENLIQIERYIYFPACAVRFGRPGDSLFETRSDEHAEEGALGTCLRVLTEVHHRFFNQYDDEQQLHSTITSSPSDTSIPDARVVLSAVRAQVLTGCCILFSGIIPREAAHPAQHPCWQMATSLGARCVREQGDEVTHVVAADHTAKTKWARAAGKYVVSSDWLLCSAFTWEWAEEGKYPLPAQNSSNAGVSRAAALSRGGGGGDDDADDVAAALAAAGGGKSAII